MQTVIHDITSIIGKKCIISALSGWGSGPRDWGLGVGWSGASSLIPNPQPLAPKKTLKIFHRRVH